MLWGGPWKGPCQQLLLLLLAASCLYERKGRRQSLRLGMGLYYPCSSKRRLLGPRGLLVLVVLLLLQGVLHLWK